jgi:signal transduction histidine kinase
VKYTRQGGISVTWGDSALNDPQRWLLTVEDTGPGFDTASGQPIATVLEPAAPTTLEQMLPILGRTGERQESSSAAQLAGTRSLSAIGKGVGLSIVKRLCEMLDAKIEMRSAEGLGTRVRVLFPRQYVG